MSEISRDRSLDTWAQPVRVQPQNTSSPLWRSNGRLELKTADQFSPEQLVEAYNQTRVDYIVPMPMNVSRLLEYIELYDVDISASWVALRKKVICGLGMLGIRKKRAWITRVGVLPTGRRQGTGRALIDSLINSASERGLDTIWLEVIKSNTPAEQLFLTSGFRQTRELIVARRPPKIATESPNGENKGIDVCHVTELGPSAAACLLENRNSRPNWLVESESFDKLANLQALYVECKNGGQGWVAFEASDLQLKHVVVETLAGDPADVSRSILEALHKRFPHQDAVMENLPANDPTWQGFNATGYFDVFRRIEMIRNGCSV
jgi:ribosomal protein S18 acetylase RimI-like enzyme